MYICQLPKEMRLEYYKRIKQALLEKETYSYESLADAMNSKVTDLNDLLA